MSLKQRRQAEREDEQRRAKEEKEKARIAKEEEKKAMIEAKREAQQKAKEDAQKALEARKQKMEQAAAKGTEPLKSVSKNHITFIFWNCSLLPKGMLSNGLPLIKKSPSVLQDQNRR